LTAPAWRLQPSTAPARKISRTPNDASKHPHFGHHCGA
jgi:hypothetical protein